MKSRSKIILIGILFSISIILLFGRIMLLNIYGYFANVPIKKTTPIEQKFLNNLQKKYNFYTVYRTPIALEDYKKTNNEYGIITEFKDFISLKYKKDSLNRIAFSIAQKAFMEINQRDTIAFVKYKVTFRGKDELSFMYTVRELE